jgi:transposase
MFIRKKLNKNGTSTILLVTGKRVAGKKNPVTVTIKHFGTAKTKNQLRLLLKQAEEYKSDIEVRSPKIRVLKIASGLDIQSCTSCNIGFSDVYGAAFDQVFTKLNLKPLVLKQLRDLAVMRIASPASKRKTARIAEEYGIDCEVNSIYKLMDKLTIPTTEQIKKAVYANTVSLLAQNNKTIDVIFYDLTTIYFETGSQDELREFGFSKDGKHQHVQIMLAVMVTTDGLVIDYQEFKGNCYEGHTLIPALNEIKERYSIDKIILVADAALMNQINLKELDRQKIKYVISVRIKNSKDKGEIINTDGYAFISSTKNEDGVIEEIKSKIIPSGDGFLVAYHSTKRAKKDQRARDKNLEKIKRHLQSTAKSKLTGALRKSYVKISKKCQIEIDETKLALDKQFDGFFGLHTNIENIDPLELLASYRGLWQVEQTFRIAKNNLEIRPIFHYTTRRIKAHFTICYMALALIRHVEFILRKKHSYIPSEELHLLLDRIRVSRIVDANHNLFEMLEDPPQELASIYQALSIKTPAKFICKPTL